MNRRWADLAIVAVCLLSLGLGVAVSRAVGSRQPDQPYTKIEDGLWMGEWVKQPPKEATAVLNLCEIPDPYRLEVNRWEPIGDRSNTATLGWLKQMVDFLQQQRREGRTVYVHCKHGVNRSGLVVTAFEMAERHLTADEALEFVQARRPDVQPNHDHTKLLQDWQKTLQKAGIYAAAPES